MKRILFIPYGTRKAPATRYRVIQYLPFLKREGYSCSVLSAISGFSTFLMIESPDFNRFFKMLYYFYVFVERMLRLVWAIIISWRYDIVFLQRTTFPFCLEKVLKTVNGNIIFDIDDAIYLPDMEGSDFVTGIKRYIKEKEVINILKVSRTVIVENEYIKSFVQRFCSNIYKIPGPIDTDRFYPLYDKSDRNCVVIGWIGSPATTSYLHILDGVLKAIKEKYPFVRFRFIGIGKYENPDITFEKVNWNYETEVSELQNFDIGIMPMPDNEWTRGKLGCKMLQYMAVGIPAVVSYTPTNAEIIKHGENGLFAGSQREWIEGLSRLIENESLRNNVGRNGRETILRTCSIQANASKYKNIFELFVGNKNTKKFIK